MNKISEIEPGTSVCHFTLNRGLNRFWRAHTRGTTYTPTHTHSHISCGVTSPAHASQGGSFSTLAARASSDFHRQRFVSTHGKFNPHWLSALARIFTDNGWRRHKEETPTNAPTGIFTDNGSHRHKEKTTTTLLL